MLFVQAFEKISFSTEAGGEHESQRDIASEEPETTREEEDQLEMLEDDTDASHEPR